LPLPQVESALHLWRDIHDEEIFHPGYDSMAAVPVKASATPAIISGELEGQ
jgi:hypothetical protein